MYYQHNLARLATCNLNIHGLLHIADGIEAMGPVWCYWAYPMERFCGSLLRAVKSRRFPFTSIDKRVCDLAQIVQLKHQFGLEETLQLDRRRTIEEKGQKLPLCQWLRLS